MKERGYIFHIANLLTLTLVEQEIFKKAKQHYCSGYFYYNFEKEVYCFGLSVDYREVFKSGTTHKRIDKTITKEQYKAMEKDLINFREINKIPNEFYSEGEWISYKEKEKLWLEQKILNNLEFITATLSSDYLNEHNFTRFKIVEHKKGYFSQGGLIVLAKSDINIYLIGKQELFIKQEIACYNELLRKISDFVEIKANIINKEKAEQQEKEQQEMLEEVQKFLSEDLLANNIKLLEGKSGKAKTI
jgi:hypothetical protein